MERLTNKQLVRKLMSARGIEMITITTTAVLVQINKALTPRQADELCASVGQPNAAHREDSKGHQFLIFSRF